MPNWSLRDPKRLSNRRTSLYDLLPAVSQLKSIFWYIFSTQWNSGFDPTFCSLFIEVTSYLSAEERVLARLCYHWIALEYYLAMKHGQVLNVGASMTGLLERAGPGSNTPSHRYLHHQLKERSDSMMVCVGKLVALDGDVCRSGAC